MTVGRGAITGVSIAHGQASVEDLEAADPESQRKAVARLLDESGVDEAFVLQTCNRVEGYVVSEDTRVGHEALDALTAGVADEAVVEMCHERSLRHLLRVASGLESIVLGEDQILGQVRDAYQDARSAGGIGPLLSDGVTKAIHVGERARTETAINEGVLSMGSAAVRLATEACPGEPTTGVVVGAGEMGRLAAKSLAEPVDRLLIANRTVSHAEHVADLVGCRTDAVGLDALGRALSEADVAITATGSPDHVVGHGVLSDAGRTVVVDIAQPRDVPESAGALTGISVYDLDDLESVTDETRSRREEAAEAVEAIVDEEFERLLSQYKRKRADQVISAMYESAERIKARQLQTALGKLDLDDDQRAVVESMADAIVSQLLAAPTTSLRDAAEDDDWSTIHTALQLFDPEFGPDEDAPPEFVADMQPEEIPQEVREEIPGAVIDQLDG